MVLQITTMKKTLLTIGILASSTAVHADLSSGSVAGSLLAGFDFSEIGSVSFDANGFKSSSDGLGSDVGTIYADGTNGSSDLNQTSESGTQFRFATSGRAPANPSFRYSAGFDNTITNQPATASSGQNSLRLLNSGSNASFVIALANGADNNQDLTVEFDYALNGSGWGFDVMNFYYSDDGISFTEHVPSTSAGNFALGPDYVLEKAATTNTWTTTTAAGLAYGTIDGQSNGVITVDKSDFSLIKYLKFEVEFTNASDEFYMDNISITGSQAVPEASTYALIAGALALGFAVIRRRK